jgi:hypothetical protein
MALSANKIKMVKQTKFISYAQMGIVGDFVSMGVNGDSVAEVNSSNMGGVLLDTDGSSIAGLIQLPTECDRDNDIGIRVVFSSASTTAADKANWIVLYKALIPETTVVEAAATALNTTIATDTIGDTTAHVLRQSPQGIINGGTLGDTVRYLIVDIEADDLDTALTFYGIELEFTPKFYKGRITEAPAWAND